MPRRSIWTARQRTAPFDLPKDEAALLRHYTLSGDDIDHIRVRRGGHNRLGFALQFCAFRYPGRILVVGEAIPLNLLRFIAAQIGMRAEDLDGYAVREETRREHLAEIRRIYGYRMFSGRCARDLRSGSRTRRRRHARMRSWRGVMARKLVYDPPMSVQLNSVTETIQLWPEQESAARMSSTLSGEATGVEASLRSAPFLDAAFA